MTSIQSVRAVVLDMQPIDPPIGGGRLRVLGIYHALGFPTTYFGTYDWPGPTERRHRLSPTLEEVDIPLSAAHFQVNEQWQGFNLGRTLIDSAFPLMAQLSTDFVGAVTEAAREADIVVFSHPWVYPLVRSTVDDVRQLLVYDAQNFEGLLRAELLDDGSFGSEIVKHVIATEYELARRADVVLTCGPEDAALFRDFYGVEPQRLRHAPNGVFCEAIRPATRTERKDAKRALGLAGPCALFLASAFRPNVDAVRFICEKLAAALPDVTFLVCGGVCGVAEVGDLKTHSPPNVVFSGLLADEQKTDYLRAADLAVNPVFAGSGSNVKMFEFAAAGLPIVTTSVGARGIELGSEPIGLVVEASQFATAISSICSDPERADTLGRRARQIVERSYAWEKISPRVGRMLADSLTEKRGGGERAAGSGKQTHPGTEKPDEPRQPDDTSVVVVEPPPRFALVSSWGIRCGIAENSRHLTAELAALGAEYHVLGNVLVAEDDGQIAQSDSSEAFVERIWRYREQPGEAIVEACIQHGVDRLWIQYHTAFFDVGALSDVLERARRIGLAAIVTLHDTAAMSMAALRTLATMEATFVLPDDGERSRLARLGFRRVAQIPLGMPDRRIDEPNGRRPGKTESSPVLGTFGFLRPHKGIRELIESAAILAPLFPSMRILALTAMYSAEESKPYLAQCQEAVDALHLQDRVEIRTDYLSIEEVVGTLRTCDLIVLPYHRTNEGASAAAQFAVASRRPVIVTRQPMFRGLGGITYAVEGEAPPLLAAGIASVLNSPILQEKLRSGADAYIRANSFSSVAKRYAALLLDPGRA